jgi:hypothetical protein
MRRRLVNKSLIDIIDLLRAQDRRRMAEHQRFRMLASLSQHTQTATRANSVMAKAKAKAPEEDEIDYGATADMHASDDDTSMAEGEDAAAIEGAGDAEDDSSSDEDEDRVEANDEDQADDIDEHEEEGSSGGEEDGEEEEEEYLSNHNIVVDGGDEPCTFDLRNLLAFNAHPIDAAVLYAAQNGKNSKQQPTTGRVTIPSMVAVDEKHLYRKAEAGCQQLIAALWQLPTERSDAGPMVKLPTTDDSRVPRALVCSWCTKHGNNLCLI